MRWPGLRHFGSLHLLRRFEEATGWFEMIWPLTPGVTWVVAGRFRVDLSRL
jgi:hypothetical protein